MSSRDPPVYTHRNKHTERHRDMHMLYEPPDRLQTPTPASVWLLRSTWLVATHLLSPSQHLEFINRSSRLPSGLSTVHLQKGEQPLAPREDRTSSFSLWPLNCCRPALSMINKVSAPSDHSAQHPLPRTQDTPQSLLHTTRTVTHTSYGAYDPGSAGSRCGSNTPERRNYE